MTDPATAVLTAGRSDVAHHLPPHKRLRRLERNGQIDARGKVAKDNGIEAD